jgi:hypothetical protein
MPEEVMMRKKIIVPAANGATQKDFFQIDAFLLDKFANVFAV